MPILEAGVAKVEKMLGVSNLYDQRNIELAHQLNAALKAWNLFHRDQQYIVKDGEVIIVDEFTGRLMYGRRYSRRRSPAPPLIAFRASLTFAISYCRRCSPSSAALGWASPRVSARRKPSFGCWLSALSTCPWPLRSIT